MPNTRVSAGRFRLPWLHGDILAPRTAPLLSTASSRQASTAPLRDKRALDRAAAATGASAQRSSSTGASPKRPNETTKAFSFSELPKAEPRQKPLLTDIHSSTKRCCLDGDCAAPYAVIAPPYAPARSCRQLPTVLAISGEEQLHVSRFFTAWRAEKKDWQVVVPLRVKSGTPYLFDAAGVERVVQLMERILESMDGEVVPFGVESRKFHLVGTSNGGTSVAAVAARVPHLVASLTLVTGEVPDSLVDFRSLLTIPTIRLYVGDKDEMGHYQALQDMCEEIDKIGGTAQLHILEGARHGNIGHYIDMAAFWEGLQAARWMAILR